MEYVSGYQALQVWDQEAIASAPVILKFWLGLMAFFIFSSIFFIKKFTGARAVFIFTAIGLVFTKLIAPQLGIVVFSGLVALVHVCLWPFSLYFLYKDLRLKIPQSYKMWATLTGLIILISLVFDSRDSVKYIFYLLRI